MESGNWYSDHYKRQNRDKFFNEEKKEFDDSEIKQIVKRFNDLTNFKLFQLGQLISEFMFSSKFRKYEILISFLRLIALFRKSNFWFL